MFAFNPPSRYQVHGQLGHGGFSTVYQAWDTAQHKWVAIKVFLKSDAEGVSLCRKEFERTQALNHTKIIEFYDFDVSDGAPFIVMPYFELGSMQDRIGEATEEEIWRLIHDIGQALDYIHNLPAPVLHNDLKPDNFLRADDGGYVLADFGISTALNTKLTRSREISRSGQTEEESGGRGPMAYQAPELFKYQDRMRQTPIKATDIWAFGASLYEIATGRAPFDDKGGLGQLIEAKDNHTLIQEYLDPLPSRYSGALNNLVFACMSLQTWDRPIAAELCAQARNQSRLANIPELEIYQMPTRSDPRKDDIPPRPPRPKSPNEENASGNWWIAAALAGAVLAGTGGAALLARMHRGEQNMDSYQVSQTDGKLQDKVIQSNTVPNAPSPIKQTVGISDESEVESYPVINKPIQEEKNDYSSKTQDRPSVGPFNPYHPRHANYHFVFGPYSSQSDAQEEADVLLDRFPSEPVTVVQRTNFTWEIYLGNYKSRNEKDRFINSNPNFDFPIERNGDGYKN